MAVGNFYVAEEGLLLPAESANVTFPWAAMMNLRLMLELTFDVAQGEHWLEVASGGRRPLLRAPVGWTGETAHVEFQPRAQFPLGVLKTAVERYAVHGPNGTP